MDKKPMGKSINLTDIGDKISTIKAALKTPIDRIANDILNCEEPEEGFGVDYRREDLAASLEALRGIGIMLLEMKEQLEQEGYDHAVAVATQAEIDNGAACGQLSIIDDD